jgi:dienelactone hydrolase
MTLRHIAWFPLACLGGFGCGEGRAPVAAVDSREGPDLGSEGRLDIASPDVLDDTLTDSGDGDDTALADDADTHPAQADDADTHPDPADDADTHPDPADDADTHPDPVDTNPMEPRPDPGLAGPWQVTSGSAEVAGFEVDSYRPVTDGDVPGLVLAPGFQLDGDTLAWLGTHLASHGFFVWVPTFGDGVFGAIDHSDLADAVVAMTAELQSTPGVAADLVGVGGHSRGGKVAILAATRAPRIEAILGIDPVDAVGPGQTPSPENPSVTPELMDLIKVPLGLIGSEYGSASVLPGVAPACAPAEENYAVFAAEATATPALHTWLIPDSGHNDFADPLPFGLSLACPKGEDPAATRARTKALATAFFKRYLAGDLRYASDL